MFSTLCICTVARKAVLCDVQERRWFFIRNGHAEGYHGPAVHWRHLSRWERHVCKIHLQYDPVEHERQMKQAKLYNTSMRSMTQLHAHKHGQTPEHAGAQLNGHATEDANGHQPNVVNGHADNGVAGHEVIGDQRHEV